MQLNNLPLEWLKTKLGDVVDYGKSQKCELSDVSDTTWILELEDIEKESSKIVQRLDAAVRPFKSTKNKFKKGDVLYGKLRPYLNKVIIANQDGVCSTEIIPLDAEPHVDNRYLFHWIKSETFLNYVIEVSYGVNMPRLGTQDGLAAPFVLPPLAEQKVIADKLDTLLAQVDNTKARLERIPEILKSFRQSVLAAAVSGKLTEEWRASDTSKSNLLAEIQQVKSLWAISNPKQNEAKRILKRVKAYQSSNSIGSDELPKNWSWQYLEDCVLMVVDCHNKTAPYVQAGIPLIRTSNIRDGQFVWSDLKFVDNATYEYWSKRCAPEQGDLIFTREAPMGEVAIIPPNQKVCLGQRTMLIRPIETHISAKYLLLTIMEPNFKKRSDLVAVGTGVKHYRVGDVSNLLIPVPSCEEQTEIVRRVEELFAFADRIEQAAQAAQSRVNNLTQSILAKAFRGELTADWRAANPDLISGDNSAEALLAKINSERAKLSQTKKGRSKSVEN